MTVFTESVLAIPSLGIQMETCIGLPNIPLFTSRRFIPLVHLRDFVINEGLYRWNVRYYLVALQGFEKSGLILEVAYENIKPYFPVLLEVYHGVHDLMFSHENEASQQQR
ncbi:hypothetical protein PHLCEN_2v4516 [Hermanssonia centrifuga]|uniref:Phosphatidylinositol N-acetylglucosaminyltransferase subunit H conserved domain-containing protein n=1 Tax=Hermanssonia centrifuga TaxID=98765 RepID=A0A2R6PNB1_9APHY|nr:hypothetical protein PHLCEN_2v4516 [Hermanssonia centrifuga]